jgi:hypothetical protein
MTTCAAAPLGVHLGRKRGPERWYGDSDWYYTSWSVITTGRGDWCAWEYADPNPGTTVRVLVSEAQPVLRDLCVLDGTCPEGYP